MPENDGYDLIRNVRAPDAGGGGRIPALALSAYARIEDRAEATSAGYDQHAAEPSNRPSWRRRCAALVGRGERQRGE